MKPIIRLHADEIQHYKDLFKDSLIAYAQLQCDKGPLGEGTCINSCVLLPVTLYNGVNAQGHSARYIKEYSHSLEAVWNMWQSKL